MRSCTVSRASTSCALEPPSYSPQLPPPPLCPELYLSATTFSVTVVTMKYNKMTGNHLCHEQGIDLLRQELPPCRPRCHLIQSAPQQPPAPHPAVHVSDLQKGSEPTQRVANSVEAFHFFFVEAPLPSASQIKRLRQRLLIGNFMQLSCSRKAYAPPPMQANAGPWQPHPAKRPHILCSLALLKGPAQPSQLQSL